MNRTRLPRAAIFTALVLAGVLFVGSAIATIVLLLRPRETTFNVVAETERVAMRIDRQVPWRWPLEGVRLRQVDGEKEFSGTMQLGFPVEVVMERVANGTLWINVRHTNDGGRPCEPATLFDSSDEVAGRTACEFDILISDVAERADRGRTIVLTLEGDISAGRRVGFETLGSGSALLRAGRVTMRESSIFGGNVYDAGVVELDTGDFFHVNAMKRDVPARGFVVVDERPAMTTAFRVAGKLAEIARPGGGAYPVSSALLYRFVNDNLFRVLSAILALLIGTITLVATIMGMWSALREMWKERAASPSVRASS